jgi:hypothetical protein
LDKRAILLLGIFLVAFVIISSFLLVEVARLNAELSALKRQSGDYSYNSDWVTKFVGYNPIASVGEARELYLLLVNKAPHRSYWIYYVAEDNGLPLKLETSDIGVFYEVNGTFRNYAVNCLDARLVIVYSIFKNGTANLENVKTVCPAGEYQDYYEYQMYP